ncbi:DUF4381 domain-containing protein [Vibrio rarus]|uniref:DUF4381 domain-containing protein n=1 Tax=Vibrio rarus TaxID=413403 RepID=UPI0021C328E2|nr:DUF4381 domain-containing protein [Vibrio rarus]
MSQIQQHAHTLPLKPLHLPSDPSAWPLAWGYWGILILACLVILCLVIVLLQRRTKHKAKKAALCILKQNANRFTVPETQELLRQAALSYFPRQDIAKLTGKQWLAFLDSQLTEPRFSPKGKQWQTALYAEQGNTDEVNSELIKDCEHWLCHALPPKRKFRNWNES